MAEKKHKVMLVLGDWSDDGHGEESKVRIMSTHTADEIRQAYYKSQQLTGLTFVHDYKNEFISPPICSEYEDNILHPQHIERLLELGFNEFSLEEDDDGNDDIYLDEEKFAKLWFWFVGLSLEGFEYELFKEEFEPIHQWGGGNFCHQFGYGLFY